jgi:hypothetical protein
MKEFLTSNDPQWRFARTILQGIIGVIIANIDVIVGTAALSPEMRALVVALVMAVLSPLMAALGGEEEKEPVTAKHAE